MKNLPVEVGDDLIEDMFMVADSDNDGKLGWFQCLVIQQSNNQAT